MERHCDGRPDLYPAPAHCLRNRDGSHATQADRQRSLTLVARQLREAGFRQMQGHLAQGQACRSLLQRWQAEGPSAGTIKNRMAHLRWWAEKVGKAGILPADNTAGHRGPPLCDQRKQSQELGDGLARIIDPYVRICLRLQTAFGLRQEESIKVPAHYADRGDHIAPKAHGPGAGATEQCRHDAGNSGRCWTKRTG